MRIAKSKSKKKQSKKNEKKKTFKFSYKGKTVSVDVVILGGEYAVYDDAPLTKKFRRGAKNAEQVLDAKIAEYIGYDSLETVASF